MTTQEILFLGLAIIGSILLLIEFAFLMYRRKRRMSMVEEKSNMYRKSFAAKLNLTNDYNKELYDALKNKLLSFNDINSKIEWNHETFTFNEIEFAKINVRKDIVLAYLPLNEDEIDPKKYSYFNCINEKKYKNVPLRFQIKDGKELEDVFQLISLVVSKFKIKKNPEYKNVSFYEQNRGFKKLVKENLIIPFEEEESTVKIVKWSNQNGWDIKK